MIRNVIDLEYTNFQVIIKKKQKALTEAEKEALRKQIGEKFDNMRVQLKNDQFLAQEETEYFNEHQTAVFF